MKGDKLLFSACLSRQTDAGISKKKGKKPQNLQKSKAKTAKIERLGL